MTVKLPPGVRLGKDDNDIISTSEWPPPGKDHAHDERAEGEAIQPGDTVIELRDGKPVIYTQPGRGKKG
jgi:hypothetical protein